MYNLCGAGQSINTPPRWHMGQRQGALTRGQSEGEWRKRQWIEMQKYFWYLRDLGRLHAHVQGGHLCPIYWVTARSQNMTIPGGVQIMGEIKRIKSLPTITAFPDDDFGNEWDLQIGEPFLEVFRQAVVDAREKDDIDNPLNYLKARVVNGKWADGSYMRSVHAFREEEAAEAAFEAGIRSYPPYGEHYRWRSLEKVEAARAKVA